MKATGTKCGLPADVKVTESNRRLLAATEGYGQLNVTDQGIIYKPATDGEGKHPRPRAPPARKCISFTFYIYSRMRQAKPYPHSGC